MGQLAPAERFSPRLARVSASLRSLEHQTDFAGLIAQAARAAELTPPDEALFDHVLVDDYQDATLAQEALVVHAARRSLVVAGDPGSHVFSFQGTTDAPIERFPDKVSGATTIELVNSPLIVSRSVAASWDTRPLRRSILAMTSPTISP